MRTVFPTLFGLLAAFSLFPIGNAAAGGGTLSIAAAADLQFCLEKLDAEFQLANPGVELKVAVGSSGNFFAQIQNGAPFDVFLSADLGYPLRLIEVGKDDSKSLTRYAVGRLVLWTLHPEAVDLSQGLQALRDPAIQKIAIANPEHAPYGRAAKAALEKAGLYPAVKDRLVLGENIAQTAQFVQSGNAEVGLVALSLVLAPKVAGLGKYQEIPEDSYPPLEQAAVITAHGADNPLAPRYIEFLRSKRARAIFDQFGFRLPVSAAPSEAGPEPAR